MYSDNTATDLFERYSVEFNGRRVVMTDTFHLITGIKTEEHPAFFRLEAFTPGVDWNGYGWDSIAKQIKYTYFYLSGFVKALRLLSLLSTIKEGGW